jgi:hypothetical protein
MQRGSRPRPGSRRFSADLGAGARRKIYCFEGTSMKTRDSLVRAAVVAVVALFTAGDGA